MSSVTNLVNSTLDSLLQQVQSPDLSEIITRAKDPFKKFKTSFLRTKMYKESENYVAPREIKLGIRMAQRFDRISKSYKFLPVPSTYMYVPIRESLKSILAHPDVFETLMLDNISTPGVYSNYSDGNNYKSLCTSKCKNMLFILLFYDDFECVNPLGSLNEKTHNWRHLLFNQKFSTARAWKTK